AREKAKAEAEAKRQAEKEAQAKQREQERIAREQAKKEAEAKRQAALEAKRQAEEAAQIARAKAQEETRAQVYKTRITQYLQEAREKLKENRFKDAVDFVKKVLDMEENAEAQALLVEIDQAKEAHKQEQEYIAKENELQEKADDAAKQHAQEEDQQKKNDAKIKKYIDIAEKSFKREDYGSARRYAYMAQDVDPNSTVAAEMVTRIDKTEMFGHREEEVEQVRAQAQKAVEIAEEEGDPFYAYDEDKTWYQYVGELFQRKRVNMTRIEEGQTYSIDDCVQIALNRSQRKIVYDKQVKLSEMRVWEARRDLLPSVTVKTELGSGKVQGDGLLRHYRAQKYAVEVKHTAFDGFKTWYELRQQQANLVTTKLERQKIVNEIIDDTKRAYYSLDKSGKNLSLQAAHKKRVNDFYNIMEKAYQEELVSHMDYLNVKGLNLQTNFSYISAGEDIELAELVLFQAMNLEPNQHIKIKSIPKPTKLLSIGLENCYMLAFANNPNYRVKVNTIKYYDFERKMMKAEGFPKIDFNASFGASYEMYQPMNSPNDVKKSSIAGQPIRKDISWEPEWYAGGKGSIPVWGSTLEYNYVREHWAPTVSQFRGSETATSYFTFKFLDNLAYFSNLQEARTGMERAKYEQLKAKQDLIVQVKEAYFGYRKALLQMELAEAKYEHQKMYVDVLVERYRFGEFDMPKLIEEYEKFTEMEYGMLSSYTDYYTALLAVNRAIGIPDYYRDEHEDSEYIAWKEQEAKRKEEEIKALQEEAANERTLKITEYLEKAQGKLDNNQFESAREYARKAFKVEEDSQQVQAFLVRVDEAEKAYQEEQVRIKREEDEKKQAEREAREKQQEEAQIAREKAKAEEAAKRQAEKEAQAKQREQERIAREQAKKETEAKRQAELAAKKKAEEAAQIAREKAKAEAAAKRQAEKEAQAKQREQERIAREQAKKETEAK
ncbi:MAG: TolC family protein, partial [Candidatus Omnitrophota bacterium]